MTETTAPTVQRVPVAEPDMAPHATAVLTSDGPDAYDVRYAGQTIGRLTRADGGVPVWTALGIFTVPVPCATRDAALLELVANARAHGFGWDRDDEAAEARLRLEATRAANDHWRALSRQEALLRDRKTPAGWEWAQWAQAAADASATADAVEHLDSTTDADGLAFALRFVRSRHLNQLLNADLAYLHSAHDAPRLTAAQRVLRAAGPGR